jgi:hypothetical protein
MIARKVVYSKTFIEWLLDFTERGEQEYGERLAQEKKRLVFSLFDEIIAATPAIKPRHPTLRLVV